jgi:hypothetical protein
MRRCGIGHDGLMQRPQQVDIVPDILWKPFSSTSVIHREFVKIRVQLGITPHRLDRYQDTLKIAFQRCLVWIIPRKAPLGLASRGRRLFTEPIASHGIPPVDPANAMT